MCYLAIGDKVQVIGPFGASFLMPNHPKSHVVMTCTGTGSAPMRAMTEWRRRLRSNGEFEGGRLMLFYGARTKEELPYFGPLQSLPKDFIDIHLYVCGLKAMEEGVVLALRDIARELGLDWEAVGPTLKREGRLHLETY
jgi:benzoyl-CoA 2,3-epoxidase subunit A